MEPKKLAVKHFISEYVTVQFISPPSLAKKPPCPDVFIWREKDFAVEACLSEWIDFSRRGRMAQNMQPQHAQVAGKRGSWGVGRFYFDVQTQGGRFFRLYYDRAPKDAFDRSGRWVLLAELIKDEDG